ncbi:unnamed protein product, partial [Ectocarpus sp. 12 AP-2014]
LILLASDAPASPKRRKDSLAQLIGTAPIGSTTIDGVENIADAMQARKKQGWSDKAKSYATPTTWSGGGQATVGLGRGGDGTAAGLATGALTARSDATSAGALTARSKAGNIKPLTLADEWRLRDFSFTAMELERVKTTPFHRLQRKELKARKLLGRFHDGQDTAPAEELARASERRCAAVRAKDKAARTSEESEWVEIDKKIFPEFWRQKDRQEARLRQFDMTWTSPGKPPTASEDDDDSELGGDGGSGGGTRPAGEGAWIG